MITNILCKQYEQNITGRDMLAVSRCRHHTNEVWVVERQFRVFVVGKNWEPISRAILCQRGALGTNLPTGPYVT